MTILASQVTASTTGPARQALARPIEPRAPVNGRQPTAWPGRDVATLRTDASPIGR